MRFLDRSLARQKQNLIRCDAKGLVKAILRNCVRLDGNWRWDRARHEIFSMMRMSSLVIFLFLFYLISSAGIVWIFHTYVAPIPLVVRIFSAFHVDEEKWEENIEHAIAPMEKMAEQYESWADDVGYSKPVAQMLEQALWHGWYLYLIVGIFYMATFYILVVKLTLKIISDYRHDLSLRYQRYYYNDLLEIPRNDIVR